ncbi:hypothetical protein HanRHA438_Chr16g0753191 [Helianthus annuus]|nr:hypothetical protein HanIR_Chr16g0805841 [Helianthus annuus]KAJ0640417.1 hypothetical protein HanLR1_Chr16g0615211 [Helianthus annuus]KAJ0644357.1 hypothetical protein HanOQP8_Chr16g0611141 [Helianthus annuus]KAJ0835263.1 hypothetical protein HanRHA438_Chr16g0753191 [Helianthus annuus]
MFSMLRLFVFDLLPTSNIIVQSLLDCVGEESNITNAISPSIYMAPSTLRNLSPTSFQHRVVSIGPLHRADENLQLFEGRKAVYVQSLWRRSKLYQEGQTFKQMLTTCVQKVAGSIEKIKACYADKRSYSDVELATMMVMDASFILQFICSGLDYSGSNKLRDSYVPYDLVLLENQIPFFVLNDVFECTISKFEKDQSLTEFIRPLLKYTNLIEGKLKLGSHTNYDHILGCLHRCYKPKSDIRSHFPRSTIHSAVELDRAGVKFKPNEVVAWPLAMEPYVTSYARAMDMLIDTHEDIAKLVTSKVIVNHLGSNEEAANMINKICKEVVWEKFFYGKEWKKLDNHFNGYWPRKIVKLSRTYFSSPWNIIALFAGIVLFALAVVQTIFTVKSTGN